MKATFFPHGILMCLLASVVVKQGFAYGSKIPDSAFAAYRACLITVEEEVEQSADASVPDLKLPDDLDYGEYLLSRLDEITKVRMPPSELSGRSLIDSLHFLMSTDALALESGELKTLFSGNSLASAAFRTRMRSSINDNTTVVAFRYEQSLNEPQVANATSAQHRQIQKLLEISSECRENPTGLTALAEALRLKLVPYKGSLTRVYMSVLRLAYERGDPGAAHLLALRQPGYSESEHKPTESLVLMLESARLGNDYALLDLLAIAQNEYPKHTRSSDHYLPMLMSLRGDGFAGASYLLGTAYLYGEIVDVNNNVGLKYLAEAVVLGHSSAITTMEDILRQAREFEAEYERSFVLER